MEQKNDESHAPASRVDPLVRCGNCKHYQPDSEYDDLGDCKNPEVRPTRIILKYCEEFYISKDFGCIFFELKPRST